MVASYRLSIVSGSQFGRYQNLFELLRECNSSRSPVTEPLLKLGAQSTRPPQTTIPGPPCPSPGLSA
ncbi:hypothetical protein TNCV_143941 [Trichonephila clavipes]|nr:hypothetical protein TNCV_143941 [Trichonephila clavipes]